MDWSGPGSVGLINASDGPPPVILTASCVSPAFSGSDLWCKMSAGRHQQHLSQELTLGKGTCPGPCPLDAMCPFHSHKFPSRITALTSQGALESLGTVSNNRPGKSPSTIASECGMGVWNSSHLWPPKTSFLIKFPSIALHCFLSFFSSFMFIN